MHSVRFTTETSSNGVVELPEIGADAPIGYGGGISLGTAIGVPLTAIEHRITVPIQFLLPWDGEHADRQSALALFDAFASKEKTLHANPGDHRTIHWIGVDKEFLARHLGRAATSPA